MRFLTSCMEETEEQQGETIDFIINKSINQSISVYVAQCALHVKRVRTAVPRAATGPLRSKSQTPADIINTVLLSSRQPTRVGHIWSSYVTSSLETICSTSCFTPLPWHQKTRPQRRASLPHATSYAAWVAMATRPSCFLSMAWERYPSVSVGKNLSVCLPYLSVFTGTAHIFTTDITSIYYRHHEYY